MKDVKEQVNDGKNISKKERIIYFDILKTISIFLVVYVHSPWISSSTGSNITMIMTTVAVPLFFMVNGALLLNKEFDKKKHIKKVLYIILGIVIWKLFIFIICVLTRRVNLTDFSGIEILRYFITQGNLKKVPSEHLWFMYTLIKIYIVFPFIKLAIEKDNKNTKYILIFLFLFSFGIEFLNTVSISMNKFFNISKFNFDEIRNSFSPLTYGLNYLFYFVAGYSIHNKYYKSKPSKKRVIIYFIMYIIGINIMFYLRYLQIGSFVHGGYQRINNDYCNIGNLLMTFSIFFLFCRIPVKSNKVIEFIGKRTINIYYVHMIIVTYMSAYLRPMINENGAKINILRTLLAVIICIAITEILKLIKPVKKIFNLS